MRRAEMYLSDFMVNPLYDGVKLPAHRAGFAGHLPVTAVNNIDQLHGALSSRKYIAGRCGTKGKCSTMMFEIGNIGEGTLALMNSNSK